MTIMSRISSLFSTTSSRRIRQAPFTTLGQMGTPVYNGFVFEDEKDATLTGTLKYKTYSNLLLNTTIVSAGVRYFLNLAAKASWRIEASEESDEAKEKADLVSEMLNDMDTPWARVVRRAAMYRFYGFSIQEITMKRRDDGVIGIGDISPRPQRTITRWDVDKTGKVFGAVQESVFDATELYLPRRKLLYVVDDSLNDSPEGLGIFRHLVKPAKRLARYEDLEGWGYEADLRGVPVGRAPLAALSEAVKNNQITQTQMNSALDALADFLENHIKNPNLGLMLDSAPYATTDDAQTPSPMQQWDVDILRGSSDGQNEVAAAIERINREIARVMGVEQLLLGSNERGSFALARDKSQAFFLVVDSAMSEIRESVKKDLIKPLFELNGWDLKLMPQISNEMIQLRDIETVVNALEGLSRAGGQMAPDDPAINEVRELLGLSKLDLEAMAEDAAMMRDLQFGLTEQQMQQEDLNAERQATLAERTAQAKVQATPPTSKPAAKPTKQPPKG
jgi:hypothetical protein